MHARFEIVLYGASDERLRAAGEGALDEIERVDERLSFYRPESDISGINAYAADWPVKVEARVFGLLQTARRIWIETGGAFDITVGPLLRAWGFVGGEGHEPDPLELEKARSVTGMQHVVLDEAALTVAFDLEGVEINLGAIGKGLAVEAAADFLRECGVESALVHGGTSSIAAIGGPPDEDGWRICIQHPTEPDGQLAVVDLRDASLSVSAPHGKSFELDQRTMGHILDPRTGTPATGSVIAAVVCSSATEGDAYSTGLLVMGPDGAAGLAERRPDLLLLVAALDSERSLLIKSIGSAWA